MDWVERLNKVAEYIEDNLTDDINGIISKSSIFLCL